MNKPKQLDNIDWSTVIKMANMDIDGDVDDDDWEHYIYEAVMETIYGEDVWKFINQRS